jgi:hypothetical protein
METPAKTICHECHEPNQASAKKCYLCGTSLDTGRRVPKKWLATGLGLLLLLVAASGAAFHLRSLSGKSVALAKAKAAADAQARKKAYTYAQICVTSKLHVRSAAKFPKLSDPTVKVSHEGTTYLVTGWVDAKRRRGSAAHKSWCVKLQEDDKGGLRPVSVGID